MSNISYNISLRNRKIPKDANRRIPEHNSTSPMPVNRSPPPELKPFSKDTSYNFSKNSPLADSPSNTTDDFFSTSKATPGSSVEPEQITIFSEEGSRDPFCLNNNNPNLSLTRPPNPSPRTNQSVPTMSSFNISQAYKVIPEFDGNSFNLHRFIQIADMQFRRASTANDKDDFLEIINSKLVGRAYDAVFRYNTYDSWDILKKTLNLHFNKQRSMQLIHADIFSIKQNFREPMDLYSQKAEKLLDELNIASTVNITGEGGNAVRINNELLVLNSFVNGLKDPLRLILRAARTTTLREAIILAFEEEKLLVPATSARLFCLNCKTNDHHTNNCRVNKNFHNNRQLSNVPINNNLHPNFPLPKFSETNQYFKPEGNPVECRYCKKPGHVIENCRKRAYNNERKIQIVSQSLTSPLQNPISNNSPGNLQQPGPAYGQIQARNMREQF